MQRALPLLLGPLLLLAGCLDAAPEPAGEPTGEPVPFRTLLVASNAQLLEQQDFLGELTQRQFDAVWERHAATRDPVGPKPSVDASRERIFAAGIGPFGDGCHDVRIADARIEDGLRTIWYDVYNGSGPERPCAAVLTYPTHIIALETDTYWTFASRTFGPDGDAWPHAPWEPAPPEPLTLRDLDKGSFSPIGEDTRLLLRDAGAWNALWARHSPDRRAPEVDFTREMVVAVVVHGPTGCAGMHLGNVTHDAEARVVSIAVVLEAAPREMQCLVAFEDVYHFAAVPLREGEARFHDVAEARPPPREPAPDDPPPRAPAPVPLEPTTGAPPPEGDEPARGNYSFRTLEQGTASGIAQELRRVLRNESAWHAFWAEHTAPMDPAPDAPAVDWAREHVLAATAGARTNTCWSIRVERIDERETSVNVQVATSGPPPDAVCGQAVTHPFHYVTYPITDRPMFLFEVRR